MRIPFATLQAEFLRVLLKQGFTRDRAELCARLFAETSRDGVYSHGLDRFPAFIAAVQEGRVDPLVEPVHTGGQAVYETWDGQRGAGNIAAFHGMNRAISLAGQHGLGCVALANTNHWFRGGSYGWQAAEANCIGICWTNAYPSMPAWGARECRLGNNPLVLAVPRKEGHVVLDFAMSLYSYGKMNTYQKSKEKLPFAGGFDRRGRLTRDPGKIAQSRRALPIGLWKGSGLALLLDLIATLLTGGRSTAQIGREKTEFAVSQVFLAFDLQKTPAADLADQIVSEVIADFQTAATVPGERVRYPGQQTLSIRRENLKAGVPVDPEIWRRVLEL